MVAYQTLPSPVDKLKRADFGRRVTFQYQTLKDIVISLVETFQIRSVSALKPDSYWLWHVLSASHRSNPSNSNRQKQPQKTTYPKTTIIATLKQSTKRSGYKYPTAEILTVF